MPIFYETEALRYSPKAFLTRRFFGAVCLILLGCGYTDQDLELCKKHPCMNSEDILACCKDYEPVSIDEKYLETVLPSTEIPEESIPPENAMCIAQFMGLDISTKKCKAGIAYTRPFNDETTWFVSSLLDDGCTTGRATAHWAEISHSGTPAEQIGFASYDPLFNDCD